jgi:hypothetical protein
MKLVSALGCVGLWIAISACTPSPQTLPSNTPTETPPVSTEAPSVSAETPPISTETPPVSTETGGETTFTLTLGDRSRDRGINLLQTRDGGYALVGYTGSFGAGLEDVYLVRLNPQGEVLWSQTYGGTSKDNGWAILETAENGFMIFGFTSSFGAGGMDMYLIKTDAKGNSLWERTFGGPNDEYGWAMTATPDGGYALAGQTESFGEGDKDGYLVKVNADGEEIWAQTFGETEEDRLYSIDQAADDGFVLVGTTRSFGDGDRKAYLVKTDSSGELAWTQVFGQEQDDVGHSVRQTADGGYIVTGYTRSFDASSYDVWLIKTDEVGDLEWQEFYGGNGDDRTIYGEQTHDGGYILTGYTKSFGAGGWDVFLVRADPSGEVSWHKTFGGKGEDTGYTVRQTSDRGFILTGETYSLGEGGGDMYVIKTDQHGETSDGGP